MNYKKEINFILDILDKNLTSNPSIKLFNSITGKTLDFGDSYEDLADYLPFIQYYNKNKLFNLELKKTIKYLKENNFIYVKEDKLPFGLFARSYAQSDLIFGLILASLENKKFIKITEKTFNSWYSNFFKTNSMFILRKVPFFTYFNLPKFLNFKLKIISSEDFGMFIELSVLLFEITKKKKYLKIAKEIYLKLITENISKGKFFFPFYISKNFSGDFFINNFYDFSKRKNEFQLIKQNSNSIFGLIRLIKNSSGDEKKLLIRDFKNFIDYFIDNFYNFNLKFFSTSFNFKNKNSGSDLTIFHIIELLIEAYLEFSDKKYLKIANDIVEETLINQNKKTHLIPFLNPNSNNSIKRFNILNNVSWLDSEIDFLIATLRLVEITKNKIHFNKMELLLDGIIKYHKASFGYVSEVNIISGNITNPTYSTKMQALVLKAFIAFENFGKLNDKENKIYYVLQDR